MTSPARQILRDHWRLIGTVAAAWAVVAAVVVMRAPRDYVAHGSFLPQGSQSAPARLTGLAAQFGLSLPASEPSEGPDFFAEVVQSRTVLDSAVADVAGGSAGAARGSAELARLFGITDDDPDVRHDKVIDEVRRRLLVTVGLRTGIVALDFRAPTRPVATQVVANIVAQVNHFVVVARRTQAANEGAFAQQRLDTARLELRRAEDSLVAFSEANRMVAAPRLQVDRERLQRAIDIRQQVVTTVAQLYEQARLDAQRATPSIVVLDAPASLARPLSRHLVATIGVAALLGAALTLAGLAAAGTRTSSG